MNNDLISRSALLTVPNVRKVVEYGKGGWSVNYDAVPVELIEAAPAVDAEPVRHGRWINKGYITTAYGSIDTGDCSECGAVDVPIEPYDEYCPRCGAKMDAGGEEVE